MDEVLGVLKADGRIWWEPVTGNLVLFDSKGKDSGVSLSTGVFFDLREAGQIEEHGRMRQGHPLFRGACICYVLAK